MKQLITNRNCQWLDSNRRCLVWKVTTLPTEPQPLPITLLNYVKYDWKIRWYPKPIIRVISNRKDNFFDSNFMLNCSNKDNMQAYGANCLCLLTSILIKEQGMRRLYCIGQTAIQATDFIKYTEYNDFNTLTTLCMCHCITTDRT